MTRSKDNTKEKDIGSESGSRSLSLFGIKFTEIAAAITLVLSLIASLFAFYHFLTGPIVKFIPPEMIEISCSSAHFGKSSCENESNLVIRAAMMVYRNEGGTNHSATLRSETAYVVVGMRKLELPWLYFTNRTILNDKLTPARPVMIPGNSVVAHETLFFPRIKFCPQDSENCNPKKDYLSWKNFLDLLKKSSPVNEISISFNFKMTLFDGKRNWIQRFLFGDHKLIGACEVIIDKTAADNLIIKEHWNITGCCT